MALLDRDGLPGASSLPYFFFDDDVDSASLVFDAEMLDDVKELELSLTVCVYTYGKKKKNPKTLEINKILTSKRWFAFNIDIFTLFEEL